MSDIRYDDLFKRVDIFKLNDIVVNGHVLGNSGGVLTMGFVIPDENHELSKTLSLTDNFFRTEGGLGENLFSNFHEEKGKLQLNPKESNIPLDTPLIERTRNEDDYQETRVIDTSLNHVAFVPQSDLRNYIPLSSNHSNKLVNRALQYWLERDPESLFYLATRDYPYITRERWGANPINENVEIERIEDPTNYYNTIVIHHTYKPQWQKIKELQKYFHDNGDADIGYHFVIDGDGTVYEGRPINIKGSHVYLNNTGKIGIALMGNFQDETGIDNYKDIGKLLTGAAPTKPTKAQIESLKQLINKLKSQYTIVKTGGHKDFAVAGGETECPGNTAYVILEQEGILQL